MACLRWKLDARMRRPSIRYSGRRTRSRAVPAPLASRPWPMSPMCWKPCSMSCAPASGYSPPLPPRRCSARWMCCAPCWPKPNMDNRPTRNRCRRSSRGCARCWTTPRHRVPVRPAPWPAPRPATAGRSASALPPVCSSAAMIHCGSCVSWPSWVRCRSRPTWTSCRLLTSSIRSMRISAGISSCRPAAPKRRCARCFPGWRTNARCASRRWSRRPPRARPARLSLTP